MKSDEFRAQFPTEESCINHLKELRMQEGICCKRCEEKTPHYWLKSSHKFQCKICKSRTNLKAGTIYQDSNLPLKIWYEVQYLMTSTKKGFSALEIQRQVDHKRYEPIWYMCQKIRKAMGNRDNQYKLHNDIEIDDAFFVVVDNDKKKDESESLKRGRGTDRQQVVMVMTEYETKKEHKKTYRKKSNLKYVKMDVVENMKEENVLIEVGNNINKNATCKTDGYPSYNKLKQIVKKHDKQIVKPKEASTKLPWVHTMISNAKRKLLGIHHSISRTYLQNYLDEFCYKVNRRYFLNPLERLLKVAAVYKWQ